MLFFQGKYVVEMFFLTRLLNDNLLEGQVPEELYSVGVHDGAIEYVIL